MSDIEDPVSYLDSLMDKRKEEREAAPVFPGSTPPRNTATTKEVHDNAWLEDLPYSDYLIAGTPRKLYTIGSLAKALGKKPVTIRSWEAKGWLPAASFRTPPPSGPQIPGKATKGRRLYSMEQLKFLVEAYQQHVLDNNDWDAFKSAIKLHYPRN
jgi:hypothetical protein